MSTNPLVIPLGEELPGMPETPAELAAREARRAAHPPEADKPPKRKPGKRASAVRQRFGLLNAMLDRALPRLTRTELAAWLLLYRHAKPDGTVTASVGDLARRAGCCVRSMRYALKRLHAAGLVRRLKRGTLAGGPSVWRLMPPDGGS